MMVSYYKTGFTKKASFINLFVILLLFASSAIGQEVKTKRELKEEKKEEEVIETRALLEGKIFTFEARTAITNKGRSINLNSNPNYMKVSPDMIESSMPFFGRVTGTVGYGSDAGYDFKGKPEKLEISPHKKNHKLDAEVKGENDTFRIYLDISDSGSATLNISSNNRTPMTYYGHIYKTKTNEK